MIINETPDFEIIQTKDIVTKYDDMTNLLFKDVIQCNEVPFASKPNQPPSFENTTIHVDEYFRRTLSTVTVQQTNFGKLELITKHPKDGELMVFKATPEVENYVLGFVDVLTKI